MFLKPKQREDKRFHGIHITHNDADAVGCALVLSYFNPSYDYEKNTYFCAIGTQDKKVLEIIENIKAGKEESPQSIVISDLSLSIETCQILEDFCFDTGIKLMGFDHHITNNLDEEFDWWDIIKVPVHRSSISSLVEVSATFVIHNHFAYSTTENIDANRILPLTWMISDYDTWTWRKHPELYNDSDVNADIVGIICSILRPEKMFKQLYEFYCGGKRKSKTLMFPDLFYTLYDIEVENRDRYLKSVHYKTRIYEHNGARFGMFISENVYSNAVAEYLYNTYDCIDLVMMIYPSSKKIGLRTKRNDINCGEIAKKYFNGGGHKSAAGASIDNDNDFAGLLTVYYTKTIPLDDFLESKLEE